MRNSQREEIMEDILANTLSRFGRKLNFHQGKDYKYFYTGYCYLLTFLALFLSLAINKITINLI